VSWLRQALGREHPPRVAIVAAQLAARRQPRYLEIGVHTGVVFLHVRAAAKVAVDPDPQIPELKRLLHPNTVLRGRVIRATSDHFFTALARGQHFDVVFIDGHHSFDQSARDIANALSNLRPDGVILVHDCDPPTAESASPDPLDAGDGPWCGDVWKAIVQLRATRDDLRVNVLDTDCGVAVIRRGESETIDFDVARLPAMTYAEMRADRQRLLGLTPWP
jgi:predicted O-methyltransferase YrrM